jgi:hypothetical protein
LPACGQLGTAVAAATAGEACLARYLQKDLEGASVFAVWDFLFTAFVFLGTGLVGSVALNVSGSSSVAGIAASIFFFFWLGVALWKISRPPKLTWAQKVLLAARVAEKSLPTTDSWGQEPPPSAGQQQAQVPTSAPEHPAGVGTRPPGSPAEPPHKKVWLPIEAPRISRDPASGTPRPSTNTAPTAPSRGAPPVNARDGSVLARPRIERREVHISLPDLRVPGSNNAREWQALYHIVDERLRTYLEQGWEQIGISWEDRETRNLLSPTIKYTTYSGATVRLERRTIVLSTPTP